MDNREREKSLRPKISQGKEYCSKVKRKDVFLSGRKASPPLGQEAEIEKSNRPGRALWAASGRGGGWKQWRPFPEIKFCLIGMCYLEIWSEWNLGFHNKPGIQQTSCFCRKAKGLVSLLRPGTVFLFGAVRPSGEWRLKSCCGFTPAPYPARPGGCSLLTCCPLCPAVWGSHTRL